MRKKTLYFYILNTALIMLTIWSCNRIDLNNASPVSQAEQSEQRLSGIWSGRIDGNLPYFNNNPLVTLDLMQSDDLLAGIIRTSDGSFKNDTLADGIVTDSIVFFRAEQSDFYTGSIMEFSGRVHADTISGLWHGKQSESGSWYAVRVP